MLLISRVMKFNSPIEFGILHGCVYKKLKIFDNHKNNRMITNNNSQDCMLLYNALCMMNTWQAIHHVMNIF